MASQQTESQSDQINPDKDVLYQEVHTTWIPWLMLIPAVIFIAFWIWGINTIQFPQSTFRRIFDLPFKYGPLVMVGIVFWITRNRTRTTVLITPTAILIKGRNNKIRKSIPLADIEICKAYADVSLWSVTIAINMNKRERQTIYVSPACLRPFIKRRMYGVRSEECDDERESCFVFRRGGVVTLFSSRFVKPILIGTRDPLRFASLLEIAAGRKLQQPETLIKSPEITEHWKKSAVLQSGPPLFKASDITVSGIVQFLLIALIGSGVGSALLFWGGIHGSPIHVPPLIFGAIFLLFALYMYYYILTHSTQTIELYSQELALGFGPISSTRLFALDDAAGVERIALTPISHVGFWQPVPGALTMQFGKYTDGVRITYASGYTLTIATRDIAGLEQALMERLRAITK